MLESIFITGLYRSGTTLLEKLIHNHPKCFVASQPFPKLYIKIKKQFLASKDTFSRLPLNDLFKNNTVFEFTKYLEETTISKKKIEEILLGIGIKSKVGNSNTEKINLRISEGDFYDLYKEINFQLSKSIKKERGKIYDRNGELIATNIDTRDFYIDTRKILNKTELKKKLQTIFPNKKETYFS